jgi:hypothetical protein
MVLLRDPAAAMEHLRTKLRVDLHVPVVFEWRNRGERCHAPGFTRNVSPEGLYVISEVSPPAHVVARCRLVLPPLQSMKSEIVSDPAAGSVLDASNTDCDEQDAIEQSDSGFEAVVIGRVVRTEAVSGEQVGFAVQARVMILREFDLPMVP